jgi:predicted ATPase
MLLRLHVKGFKNLRDVQIRFGPLTCFVGPNGVGKSNIFDAIQFLRRLADEDIQTAAEAVRSAASGGFGPLDLFWNADTSSELSFEVDMIVPRTVVDDFGVEATPATTLLRYAIAFRHRSEPRPRLELVRENLTHLQKGEARAIIGFRHKQVFRNSVVHGKRYGGDFISTKTADRGAEVFLHGDAGSRGRPAPAGNSPRTILGGTNTANYPTVLAARREMSSWHALHLEPSALRSPDAYSSAERVDERGAHIAATLHRLGRDRTLADAQVGRVSESPPDAGLAARVLEDAANRLARLVPDVDSVRIDEDRLREQRVVQVKMRGSERWFGPRSLSDGTLRFLALVAMQMDFDSSRVLCMEEPENGIDPARVPEIVKLLQDFAVDPELPVTDDNPARQVVVNTHSPDVVRQLDAPDVLFVRTVSSPLGREAVVRPVNCEDNWRGGHGVTLGELEDVIGGAPLGAALRARQLRLWADQAP